MIAIIQTILSRAVARLAYALAPSGSDVDKALGPIWRPGAK